MKKIIAGLISMAMLTATAPAMAADNEITVFVDGTQIQFEVPPMIIDGTTFVPMRAIFEALGALVEWDDATKTVTAFTQGMVLNLTIDSNTVSRNTVEYQIDIAPFIHEDNTLVPIRFVAESMGCDVAWDGENNIITIKSTDSIQSVYWNDNYRYVGQTKNGEPIGYGVLYKNTDNTVGFLGIFDGKHIVEGSVYYDNGDWFRGHFNNGELAYGTYYHRDANYECTGDWTGNVINGRAYIHNYNTGESYTADYINGVLDTPINRAYARIDEIKARMDEISNEKLELTQRYLDDYEELVEERKKLAESIRNGDIYDTDFAKSIYEKYEELGNQYGYNAAASSAASNGGNIDSFAAANAKRQQEALANEATAAIMEYYDSYIENQQQSIDIGIENLKAIYDESMRALDAEYASLQNQLYEQYDIIDSLAQQ